MRYTFPYALLCLPMRLPAVVCSVQPATVATADRELGASPLTIPHYYRARVPPCSLQCRPQPVDARAVCDASGARGGFFRRPGRTADATAARPTYAPFCVLARASACTTFAVVRAPLIVLRADPISTCKGKKASAASRPGNPNRSSPTVSDPRVGPPLRYRPDKFSRRIFCSSYDAAVLPAYESRENDRVFSSLRKRKNFEIFSTCSDGGDIGTG